MTPQLTGIHHLTAVTAHAAQNYAFYTQTLGMRLVKKTVNQDDVRAYHLFYADGLASPGSDLTFFDWPTTPQEVRGSHSITRTGLRVGGASSLHWWTERFTALGVPHDGVSQRDGRGVLDFEDFEGQRLALVDDGGLGDGEVWAESPIPTDHQIRGLGPVTMTLTQLAPTNVLLTRVMGMEALRTYLNPESPQERVHVFGMEGAGPAAEVHIAVRPDLRLARPGAGGVHHVALRVPTQAEHSAWDVRLRSIGIQTSGIIDRYYFRSIYFREPNGILFELATDGPGFTVDEPLEQLGERLALPPFLEPHRADIEAHLKPLKTT
ncbi:ring-cleaving dioxygenase [Caldilinea sp.]|uniref:ring-cleaving dioxygenase n=1 Tax=Caldilinea sp. TaxID=2293560 RepID=UPI002CC869C2|nr:ring-cleaving dioxygenase [Caldilinea sp.]HRA67526.1 ring-cleaving dioxygenase [Caldilinea sp.]